MGLDITISRAEPIYCPHCGELVAYQTVDAVDGSGKVWYEFLESIGYYKPYVKGQPYSQPMYGEDMALNDEQIDELIKFVNQPDFGSSLQMEQALWLIESALSYKDKIVINADW